MHLTSCPQDDFFLCKKAQQVICYLFKHDALDLSDPIIQECIDIFSLLNPSQKIWVWKIIFENCDKNKIPVSDHIHIFYISCQFELDRELSKYFKS